MYVNELSPPGARLQAAAQIKQALDIVQVIGEYVRLEAKGNKFRGLCPFHEDSNPSFEVSPEFQNYRCWACNQNGDIFSFIQAIERVSFSEAIERLADKAGITLSKNRSDRNDRKQSLLRVLKWAQEQFENCLHDSRMGEEARQYLKERGLSSTTAQEFGLGAAPNSYEWLVQRAKPQRIATADLVEGGLIKPDQRGGHYDSFRGRLIFPIRDERRNIIGFGGRILPSAKTPNAPKYLNTSASAVYNKSEVLFGLDVAREALAKEKKRALVVMEGYTDCLMAYQSGFRAAVATCGTALTAQHLRRLRSYADEAVIMFDGDAAGQNAAKAATALFLASEMELRLCVLPDDLDPCDYILRDGVEALVARIASAQDAIEYQIDQAKLRAGSDSLEGRHRAMDEVLGVLALLPEMTDRSLAIKVDMALNRLAGAFGANETLLRQRIAQLRRGRSTQRGPDEPTLAVTKPMDRKERQLVQLLVVRPELATELGPLLDVEDIEHPDLRSLVRACYELEQEGEDQTTDSLRQRLDEPRLDELVLELCDGAPVGEAFDQQCADAKEYLRRRERRQQLRKAREGLAPDAGVNDHLELLRRFQAHRNPTS